MDAQVSLARLLIGDNVAPYTYTDAEIRAACKIPPPAGNPIDLEMVGVLVAQRFPVAS